MSLADLDLFDTPEAANARPSGDHPKRPPAVVDLSRIDTTPGAEGPFTPPIGINDGKAYARHLRQICDSLLRQDFEVVARWICTPRPHTPNLIVTGRFIDVFTTCLKRLFAKLKRRPRYCPVPTFGSARGTSYLVTISAPWRLVARPDSDRAFVARV